MASPFLIWMRKQPLRSVSNPTDSWAVLLDHFMVITANSQRQTANC